MASPRHRDRSTDAPVVASVDADSGAAAESPAESPAGVAAFEDLVQFAPDAIVVVDAGGVVRHAAASVTNVLGHRPADLEGHPFESLVEESDAADVRVFLHNITMRTDGTPTSAELRLRRADGTSMYGEATGANLLANLEARGMVITIRDISHRKSLEEQLRFQAFHDALTGLANRALFSDRLERAIRVRRSPGEIAPSVAFLDLDDFKAVNDTYGHAIGDRVLQVVAERITTTLRGADTAARFGGDEFAILIEEVIQPGHLMDLVQRVVDAISRPIVLSARTITLGASAGIAAATSDVAHGQELLRRADVAMYRAKAQGKGQVVAFDAEVPAALDDFVVRTAALDAAITNGSIRTTHAPVVDLGTGMIVSADAMVEWVRPGSGSIGIDAFLDLATDTGLLVPLFDEVAAQVVAALATWTDAAPTPPGRLSPVSIILGLPLGVVADVSFAGRLADRTAAAGIDARRIVFRVSEAVLRDDAVVDTLRSWARFGFGLAVDHFGTGQSSRHLLERVPLRCLRIDESYVAYLRENRDPTLLASLIDLAEAIGADAMADGVDSFAGAEQLWSMGCVAAAGTAFGGPVATDAFAQLLVEEPDRAWVGFVR